MHTPFIDYVPLLSTFPVKRRGFEKDLDGAGRNAGLSDEQRSALKSRDIEKISELMKNEANAAVIYWDVDHGIRLTGMPTFGRTLSDTQVWQVALFLKHMDRLRPTPEAKWKALKNPAMLVPPN